MQSQFEIYSDQTKQKGFITGLLQDRLRKNLREVLEPLAAEILDKIIEDTVVDLETDIQDYRDHMNLRDVFSIKIERRRS